MPDDIVIELDLACKTCGDALGFSGDFNRQHNYVVEVEPCEGCTRKAEERGAANA